MVIKHSELTNEDLHAVGYVQETDPSGWYSEPCSGRVCLGRLIGSDAG